MTTNQRQTIEELEAQYAKAKTQEAAAKKKRQQIGGELKREMLNTFLDRVEEAMENPEREKTWIEGTHPARSSISMSSLKSNDVGEFRFVVLKVRRATETQRAAIQIRPASKWTRNGKTYAPSDFEPWWIDALDFQGYNPLTIDGVTYPSTSVFD